MQPENVSSRDEKLLFQFKSAKIEENLTPYEGVYQWACHA